MAKKTAKRDTVELTMCAECGLLVDPKKAAIIGGRAYCTPLYRLRDACSQKLRFWLG